MYKPVIVANESWWVPAENGLKLAVKITDPENYHQAVESKLEALINQLGLEKAHKLANRILEQEGALELWPPANAGQLVSAILDNSSRLAEEIREGRPDRSEPADEEEAVSLVEDQLELTLEDFLT